MHRIFLAGSMSRIEQLKYMSKIINSWDNVRVVSTWYNNPAQTRARLQLNLRELLDSNMLVVDTFADSTSGGYHFETGVAHFRGFPIILVGPAVDLGYLSNYQRVNLYRDLGTMLRKGKPTGGGRGLENR